MPKKTLITAKETNNAVIVQVKENQKKLFASCEKTADEMKPVGTSTSRNEGRNREEKRRVRTFNVVRYVSAATTTGWKSLIASMIEVVRVKRTFDTKAKSWKQSKEIAYYVSTHRFSARTCNRAIRNHWGIENSDHYVRDVSMYEDDSRIRTNPDRMVVLRSFGLNIMRANGVKNIKRKLYANSLNLEKVLRFDGL